MINSYRRILWSWNSIVDEILNCFVCNALLGIHLKLSFILSNRWTLLHSRVLWTLTNFNFLNNCFVLFSLFAQFLVSWPFCSVQFSFFNSIIIFSIEVNLSRFLFHYIDKSVFNLTFLRVRSICLQPYFPRSSCKAIFYFFCTISQKLYTD